MLLGLTEIFSIPLINPQYHRVTGLAGSPSVQLHWMFPWQIAGCFLFGAKPPFLLALGEQFGILAIVFLLSDTPFEGNYFRVNCHCPKTIVRC